ncbi:hypothetical protein LZQ00_14710 [Sphingobacterium sp. SRCM116780]|uniref:hypothetical protein n=1 Tax=Sphingobacterium sp. SRCM116780 TaxID=2907623 RepID=UPI001F3FBD67|nr:hypothetical protein [Sphingobacterium sp. SRCM116780]UIR55510.1 hypothetical protein LZQ00_14710 [Sphingobacterium sp. SRCM116780]
MQVDHKLIEKYHLNQCTPEEKILVEEWLLDDTLSLSSLTMPARDKDQLQLKIWEELSTHINKPLPETKAPTKKFSFKYISIAASLLIILGFSIYRFTVSKEDTYALFDNSANANLKYIEKNSYELILGKHASARINMDTGEFYTVGNMMLTPKKDFTYTFPGSSTKKELKNGEIYFILDAKNTGKQVILSKSELTFLAPTIQHQLKRQFNII